MACVPSKLLPGRPPTTLLLATAVSMMVLVVACGDQGAGWEWKSVHVRWGRAATLCCSQPLQRGTLAKLCMHLEHFMPSAYFNVHNAAIEDHQLPAVAPHHLLLPAGRPPLNFSVPLPAYVISLKHSSTRRGLLEPLLKKHAGKVTYVQPFDGRKQQPVVKAWTTVSQQD